MRGPIRIGLFNATGLPRQAISPILDLTQTSSIFTSHWNLAITTTQIPTLWKQHNTYGIKRHENTHKGCQDISLFVNPHCPYPINPLPTDNTPTAQYKLSFTIADILVHWLCIPPHLNYNIVQQILDLLPLTLHRTTQTIICRDFTALMGSFTGDHSSNSRG